MRVYFIRHGIAVPRGAPGVLDDASRELTRQGTARMRKQARGLVRLKLDLDRIWTSPYVRARQTAEILAAELGLADEPRILPALAPGGSPDEVFEALAGNGALNGVALVGHEPDLSETASRVLSGTGTSVLRLKKGGVACVEIEQPSRPLRGELCWLLTPRQLRSLA